MTDKRKRLERLESRIENRSATSADRDEEKLERLFRRLSLENVAARKQRRAKWLASATRGQLESRLARVDRLEKTDLQQWERKVSAELDAAARERRRPGPWARDHSALTRSIYDDDREEIVGLLLGDRGVELTEKECFDIVRSVRADARSTLNAGLVLAAVEATAAKELGRATLQGTLAN